MMPDSEQGKGQVNKIHGPKNANSILDLMPDHVSLVLFDLHYVGILHEDCDDIHPHAIGQTNVELSVMQRGFHSTLS